MNVCVCVCVCVCYVYLAPQNIPCTNTLILESKVVLYTLQVVQAIVKLCNASLPQAQTDAQGCCVVGMLAADVLLSCCQSERGQSWLTRTKLGKKSHGRGLCPV